MEDFEDIIQHQNLQLHNSSISNEIGIIPLTQDKVALVDKEDLDYLNQWKWNTLKMHNSYYALRNTYLGTFEGKKKFKMVRMHRLILNAPKNMMVDHINGNGLDNRKSNLRICSNRQNTQNRKHGKKSSRYPGVYFNKRNKNWVARIQIKGKINFLGSFKDEKDAAKAYEKACRELVGEELICKTGKLN
ncbi:HNH endonuclease [Methanobacterium spitsbergense]|uniref:HNH endonuclease n=1 Tax=Methanobacterium spitsbergense TaxID=2874285 RepID=A0A8T5URQ0_9EURY|nr:HNH endonuclease [Methanobacterium spitsbergense]MBZ2166364.1 HNH endonuclease [Methanobacterium spitsbergense]